MKKKIVFSVIILLLIASSGLFGILIGKRQSFPFHHLKSAKDFILNTKAHWWSIGIYSGNSPLNIKAPANIKNPVLTAKDITDIKAQFVADPFIVKTDSIFYVFFEAYNLKTEQGDIGCAESKDGYHWKYKQIVLDEPFHLSYPYVFKWNNEYYLIPESHQDLSVRLYKGTGFPFKWKYTGDLLKGYHFVDPQIVYYNNLWWLFVTTTEDDDLNLYYSKNLTGPWTQHPMSPIIKRNKHIARGGGRILEYNGKLYRYTQDCFPTYGIQVFAFEITEITETNFKEKAISDSPVVSGIRNNDWNSIGMHTVDPVMISNNTWIAAVDGF